MKHTIKINGRKTLISVIYFTKIEFPPYTTKIFVLRIPKYVQRPLEISYAKEKILSIIVHTCLAKTSHKIMHFTT